MTGIAYPSVTTLVLGAITDGSQLNMSSTVQSRPTILSTTTNTASNNDDETLEIVHRTTRSTT